MQLSHFRAMAAQSFRRARTATQTHVDYESLMRVGQQFKARAMAARARLAKMRQAAGRKEENDRQKEYRDRRE
jgi:hypothetical protein